MTAARVRRVRVLAGSLTAAAAITLSGCGGLSDTDKGALRDLVEQAEKAVQDAEKAAQEAQAEAGERASAAEEALSWPSRPPPPAQEAEWRYTSSHGDWAAEDAVYPSESYDDIVDHYTDHYGEPPREYNDFVEWGGEAGVRDSPYTRVTRSGDQVGVTSTWPAP